MSNAWNALTGNAPQGQYGGSQFAQQQQQAEQNLGMSATTLGQQYQQGLAALGQQYGGQFGQLSQGFGQQASQQYGQLQNAQGAQGAALQQLSEAATGKAPSAAAIQEQQGIEQAMRSQQSLAASTRGEAGLANAQVQAQRAGAQMQQQGVANAAALRAQEMAQAREAYMQGSLGMGAQALGATQGLQTNELGALGQGAQTQLGFQQAGMQGMLGSENVQQGYEGLGLGAQSAAAQVSEQNAALQEQANAASLGAITGLAGAGVNAIGTGIAAAGGGGGATGNPAGTKPWNFLSDERRKHDVDGGEHPAALIVIAHPPEHPADRFMDSLHPHTFRYDNPGDEPRGAPDGRPYLGVMAQDVERSPEGAQAVEERPDGSKALSLPAMVSAQAAGLGRLHERLSALEQESARRKVGLR